MLVQIGTSYLMGKRGPKPVNMPLLSMWEVEFYKAFHLLRDGTQLPRNRMPLTGLTPAETRDYIQRLKGMDAKQFWLATRRLAEMMGHKNKPSASINNTELEFALSWAEQQRLEDIFELECTLKPPSRMQAQARRRKIWNDLVHANTYSALRKACGRWAQLPDVRGQGLVPFPGHVLANAGQFFAMKDPKRNKRFPKSSHADDSRLEYLARGMAGVMVGKSPLTAIRLLRNMKHGPGGPLWKEEVWEEDGKEKKHQWCNCWRCRLRDSRRLTEAGEMAYANGIRLLLEIATKIKRLGGQKK